MIHRFTIDAVADDIYARIQQAAPDSRLSRRFFREGKRAGKRGFPPDPAKAFLVQAVEMAVSRVCAEYLAEIETLDQQIAAAQAFVDSAPADADDDRGSDQTDTSMDSREQLDTSTGTDGQRGSDETATSVDSREQQDTPGRESPGARPQSPSRADLAGALDRRRKRLADQAQADRTAAAAQVQQLVLRAKQEVDELTQRRAARRTQRAQWISSCHHTGRLLWARFGMGYNRASGTQGDAAGKAFNDLQFDLPECMDDPKQQSAGQGVTP